MSFLRSEARSFRRYEAESFRGVRGTRGVRLKDTSIAKIENIDLVVQAEYLSNKRACMDQAAQR